MKKLTILIAVVVLTLTSTAQEQTTNGSGTSNGGYGSFFTKVGQINGGIGIFMGGKGAWLLDGRFGFGGKGYGLIGPDNLSGQENVKFEFGCGGGMIEYIIISHQLIHININTMIGAGSVRYSQIDYAQENLEIDNSKDVFFIVEPGIDAQLNVSSIFRIAIGISYRIVNGVNYEDLKNTSINGVSGRLAFKFGSF